MAKMKLLIESFQQYLHKEKHGAAVVVVLNKQFECLIVKRNLEAPWMPNKWAHLGGGIEDYETPRDAAKREAKEEAQLTLHTVYPLGSGQENGGQVYYFVCLPDDWSGEPKLNFEHSAYQWITAEEAKNMSDSSVPGLYSLSLKAINYAKDKGPTEFDNTPKQAPFPAPFSMTTYPAVQAEAGIKRVEPQAMNEFADKIISYINGKLPFEVRDEKSQFQQTMILSAKMMNYNFTVEIIYNKAQKEAAYKIYSEILPNFKTFNHNSKEFSNILGHMFRQFKIEFDKLNKLFISKIENFEDFQNYFENSIPILMNKFNLQKINIVNKNNNQIEVYEGKTYAGSKIQVTSHLLKGKQGYILEIKIIVYSKDGKSLNQNLSTAISSKESHTQTIKKINNLFKDELLNAVIGD